MLHTSNLGSYLVWKTQTVDVKQLVAKGQKNEDNNKNNRFVKQSSIVMYPVPSTPRSPSLQLESSFGFQPRIRAVNKKSVSFTCKIDLACLAISHGVLLFCLLTEL